MSENQAAAREAVGDMAAIEDLIVDAERRTTDARDAMAGAEESATLALNVALMAQEISAETSKKAGAIRTEAAEALGQVKASSRDTLLEHEGKEEAYMKNR